jgi:uncharacterized protein
LQEALERAIAELVLGDEIEPGDSDRTRAWLDKNAVDPADAEAILHGGLERLLVYRGLIRGNLHDAIELAMPRVVARLGKVFDECFDRFLVDRGPRTHYLRDVTGEFLDWCEPIWRSDPRVPEYMLDLARHEALQIEVGAMMSRPETHGESALELERRVRFIDAVRLVHYDHAVHELSEDTGDRTEPAGKPTSLFVYRSPEHDVRYLELSPLAARILAELIERRTTLSAALQNACADAQVALDQAVLDGTARLFADLAERGALLGAEP